MDTNYYVEIGNEKKHLGISSAGWCFALRVYPEEGIETLKDVVYMIEDKKIIDEYDSYLTLANFLHIVKNRRIERRVLPLMYKSWDSFHAQNHSVTGLNNLLRHRLGDFCVSHGEGTWDCIAAEFC